VKSYRKIQQSNVNLVVLTFRCPRNGQVDKQTKIPRAEIKGELKRFSIGSGHNGTMIYFTGRAHTP